MTFRLFGTAKQGNIVAVVDVGSGSIGFAVLRAVPNVPIQVLAAERSMLPMEKRAPLGAVSALAAEFERLSQKVLADLSARLGEALYPGSVVCVLRTPWTTAESVRESVQFDEDSIITQELITSAIKRSLSRLTRFKRADFLEATTVQFELNGYTTHEPEGKYAHDFSVVSLVSGCEPTLRAKLDETHARIFPHAPHTLRSGVRALFTVINQHSQERDYVIADVSGEGTALVVVRDGAPAEQSLLEEGFYSLLRRAAPSGLPEETLRLMRLIARDQCDTPPCAAVMEALTRAEPELVRKFGEALAKCAAPRQLPTHLFLVTHPDVAEWFAVFFSRIDFTQFTCTTKPFEVDVFSSKDLAGIVTTDSGVTLDPGLAIAAALVNIETPAR